MSRTAGIPARGALGAPSEPEGSSGTCARHPIAAVVHAAVTVLDGEAAGGMEVPQAACGLGV